MENVITNTQTEMPKEKSPTKKYIVLGIIALIIVLLAAGAFYIFNQTKNKKPAKPESKKPAAVFSPASAQGQADLISQLPYITDNFTVEYYPSSGYYSFRLRGSNYEEVKKNRDAAYSWIQSKKGFKNNEFCAFKYNVFFQNIEDNQKVAELTTFPACLSQ